MDSLHFKAEQFLEESCLVLYLLLKVKLFLFHVLIAPLVKIAEVMELISYMPCVL